MGGPQPRDLNGRPRVGGAIRAREFQPRLLLMNLQYDDRLVARCRHASGRLFRFWGVGRDGFRVEGWWLDGSLLAVGTKVVWGLISLQYDDRSVVDGNGNHKDGGYDLSS